MRYVRFATRAEAERAALPAVIRRLVTDRIIEIAGQPDPASADDLRLVAPASVNSGLIMTAVVHGQWFVMITYRIHREPDEVWIPMILAVHGEV